ncbi:MAG: DUF3866 family protein [Actinobacteria bacterium]|nr:DUF3866 family protein [Actinomycetota bacterium]
MERSLSNPPSPPILRRARVLAVSAELAEIELLEGPLAGETVAGVFYRHLGTSPAAGEEVAANTLGLEMGLGTGGVAVILPSQDGSTHAPINENHFVKLPYTPLQFPASHAPQAENLDDVPIVVLPLHSHLAPACCAAGILRPGCRVAFVWQEGGALPVAFSNAVRELKEKRLLHAVVSCGNCFGGDLEAVNVYSGLLAAAEVADLVLVGIGPGILGTGTPDGHGGMSAAVASNAALSLGGKPILTPRISGADPRERHRGLSHHTRAVLAATLLGCRVAFPLGNTAGVFDWEIPMRHSYVQVPYGAAGLEGRFGVTFESMGRRYEDDPVFFDAAVAAVALALSEGS